MSTTQVTQAPAAAPLTAALTTNQVFNALYPNAPGVNTQGMQAAILSIVGTKRLEAKKFLVRVSGTCTSVGASTTFSPFLAVGTSLVIANDVILAQPTAVTVNNTAASWYIEANLIFDSVSGKLQGNYSSMINGTFAAPTAITAAITGLNGNTEPVFSMVAGGQFSAAATGNIIAMSEFVLVE